MFFQLEPFGSRHRDYLFANLTAVVANMFRSEDSELFTPDQFIPKYTGHTEAEPYTAEQDVAWIHSMVATGLIKEQ